MEEVFIKTEGMPLWLIDRYFNNKDFVSIDDLYRAFEDLCCEYDLLKEEYDDFKRDVEDNYKPLTTAEQIGWDENW